jgi:hypothetical protein
MAGNKEFYEYENPLQNLDCGAQMGMGGGEVGSRRGRRERGGGSQRGRVVGA